MLAHPTSQRHVKRLHVNCPDIVSDPLVVNATHKAPVLFRAHGAFRDKIALLDIERAVSSISFAPTQVGQRQHFRSRALNNWNELDELCFQPIAEEAVNLERMISVSVVESAKDIKFDAVFVQKFPTPHHLIKTAASALCHTIRIV